MLVYQCDMYVRNKPFGNVFSSALVSIIHKAWPWLGATTQLTTWLMLSNLELDVGGMFLQCDVKLRIEKPPI